MWLEQLGAEITGFSLPPATDPNLFTAACVGRNLRSLIGDVREPAALCEALAGSSAEIVFHCAAQSLVRASYESPVETFATNVMGTVHMLEAMRSVHTVRAAVIVTSDKCYEERAFGRPYREGDPLGGRDPYSAAKHARSWSRPHTGRHSSRVSTLLPLRPRAPATSSAAATGPLTGWSRTSSAPVPRVRQSRFVTRTPSGHGSTYWSRFTVICS